MTNKKTEIEKEVDNLEKHASSSKTQEEILVEQLCEGMETYEKKSGRVFLSSLSAGLEIGFSFLLIAIVYTFFKGKVQDESLSYIGAFAYPVGFILVVLGRSILFTEQTSLLALPVLHKKRSLKELAGLWGLVILGNLIGGYIIALLVVWVGTSLSVISNESIIAIAKHVSHYSMPIILGSSVLAGWLMGLLSWLITSADDTISKITIIYIITTIIGLAGLHHSIVGNIEVFAGLLISEEISFGAYFSFQITALIGNALGGVVFVAVLKYRTFAANFK
ncbi:formate/nitrite transporter family protein [Ascidiimonas sp. W6]|uniref:formate/nitrite transporter family protein n=1 Tax=Ascidiimonas meishanensis TaxID=3128903 RepID=UPI0030EC9B45